MSDENKCPVELKPMQDWIKELDPALCRPCMMGVVAQWYVTELTDKGEGKRAEELEQLAEKTDVDVPEQVLTLCERFDTIKNEVEDQIRERLQDFDCAAQSYNPDAAE